MRRTEKYPFQAMVESARRRIEDAKISEGIIHLGSAERIRAFGVTWLRTGDENLAERESIQGMLLARPDLEDLRSKMHNPDRIFARGELNEELARLGRINRESIIGYVARYRRPRPQLKLLLEIGGVL